MNNKAYIFVVEVAETQNLKTLKFSTYNELIRENKPLEGEFCKHMYFKSKKIGKKQYKRDFLGRIYRNKEVQKWSIFDEFVADESLVKPRYLIEMEVEENLEEDNCLYYLMQHF